MEELRAGWEVPSIAHYCEIFRKPFRLPDFDIDELEEAFIASGSPDGSTLLTQLFIQLLKGCYPHRGIGEDSYIKYLHNVYKHNTCQDTRFSDVDSTSDFHNVPQHIKVELLYMLCHVRLNSIDVADLLKGLDGDDLRIEPIGTDNSGATYWYFDDTRLYKEDPQPPKRAPVKKKTNGRKTSRKRSTNAKKQDKQPKTKQQRQSRSLGNIANSKGGQSTKLKSEATTHLRTRSVHNFRSTRGKVTSDVQSDSSDESPLRKHVKKESESEKTEAEGRNVNTRRSSDNSLAKKDVSIFDSSTPRRSSRTRSTTTCYQAVKVKKEEPADQSSSDSDSDVDNISSAGKMSQGRQCDTSDSGSGCWHVVCVTIEDWTTLSEQFHKSSVACERKLYRRLTDDIIPLVETLYEQKEKLRRRKLLEVAPRRTSGRLEVKRHMKVELEEKYRELGGATNASYNGEWRERQKQEEERQQGRPSEEMEKKQKEERERERERARKDRMRRAELRQLRACLIAEGKCIPPELFEIPGKHRDSEEESDEATSLEDLWTAMGRVLSLVRERRDAWPFRRPVDEEFAPGYLSFIEHPMDLATMNEKLKARVYTGRDQFADDLHLIFDNCRKYNGPNSDYTALANKLEKFVNQCIGKYLPVEEEESSSSSSEGSSASSDDDDRYEHYKDDSDRAHYQPSQYIQTQTAWTSSLYRTSTSSLSVPSPSSSQVRRPCYATSCSPRKTSLLKGASTIITIRRIPDSTPPTKFYASGNISHSGQHPVGNLTGLAGGESKDQYQIVAVPAAGFITDVACTAIPTTATQNTVQQHPQVNQNRLVTTDVLTVESVSQSHPVTVRTYGQVANTVIVTSTHAASVSTKPVSLLTHGLTTQTLQQTAQTRPVVSCVGRGSPAGANFQRGDGHSVGKQTGGVAGIGTTLGSSPSPRLVVTSSPRLVMTSVPSPRQIVTSVPSPRLVVTSVPSPRLVMTCVPSPRLVVTSVPSPRLGVTSVPSPRLVVNSVPSPRQVVTSVKRPVNVTGDSRLSPATHELTDSCQYMKSTDCLQLSPSVLPQLGVTPGHSPKSLVDHGQQKLLVNGQISNTGCH